MSRPPEEAQRDPRQGAPEESTTVADLRPEGASASPARHPEAEPGPTDRTVGTGSFFAIGCTIGAVAVIAVGILAFVFMRVF